MTVNRSKDPPRARLVVDGGPTYGYGHLSRSRAVALAFETAGFLVDYVDLLHAPRPPDATPATAAGVVTIIDLPYDGDAWLYEARHNAHRVIGLDYLGRGCPDILIRMNTPLGQVPCRRLCYGLEYAIIRHEIRAAKAFDGDHVLVAIGGGDLRNVGMDIAQAISEQGLRTILVRGPLAQRPQATQGGFLVLDQPADFAQLLAGCAWAVTNGGTTMVEAMSLGKAVHAVPQTSEEERFAADLLQRRLLLGVGRAISPPSSTTLHDAATRARAAVDGRGADRIVELAHELIACPPHASFDET
ncbi:MAG: hypothetical protein IT537_23100 [Hyphomicrobiales bacterium]|nr:hypothetical protein [Hyphomicrobiales bacterium]